ncbi:hypothetical protein DS38502_08 [Lactococcus phage 38502]|jgi:hypothetical protein|uniref:DUF1408 domain-containing protein n=4 Tax=Vedamuthuvirus TaxID=2843470 RepID=R9QM20_9CAUD|nr:DUF1408 domain-containing protein [Lactococcus cremoris]YP_008320151.1 DUF1408 domain-containing protein [Lactococcus phage BM13]YP_009900726.1 DUF1408 domain-containing protein [Lactococcus phage 62503]YP_009900777.1 DUF1408 domain-containing protein [Lactococcus phage P1045]ANT43278.1 hypothetical protein DS38502_08 [Lactococcus phage 38502]ANT43555.1 hypothetical protein DS58502_08 [Lactococcus phage 58502]ANT43604.1 hypothetical protein DS62502_08 [Lactococcus phage 62502]NCB80645.1 D
METTIINGRKVRVLPTNVGQIYHDLIKRENRGVVVFETWERPDGSLYMTSRKKNKQELAADKAAMLNECISDWKKVWK